jgi:hypothetical protein
MTPEVSAPAAGGPIDAATLTWPVACLLALWDSLDLELGEAAVVTEGHPWSGLAAVVAGWYGATPVLYVTAGTAAPAGTTPIRVEDPSETVRGLASRLQGRPGVAVAELSGRAAIVDIVLESIPSETGIAMAGEGRERLTIDFYVNVHRKGLHMVSTLLDPGAPDVPGRGVTSAHVVRAQRLLAQPARLAQAGAAWTGAPSGARP